MSIQRGGQNSDSREFDKRKNADREYEPAAYIKVNAADGRILDCNKAAQNLLECPKNAILRMKVFELFADTPLERPKVRKIFEDLQVGKTIPSTDFHIKKNDGHLVPVRMSAKPEVISTGTSIKCLSVMLDVFHRDQTDTVWHDSYGSILLPPENPISKSEQKPKFRQEDRVSKEVEEDLRGHTRISDVLLNNTNDLILLLDPNGYVVTANTQACERYGKTLRDLIGSNIYTLMNSELADSCKKMAATAIQDNQPVSCFEKIGDKLSNCIIYPILEEDKVSNYIICIRDLTPLIFSEHEVQIEVSFKILADNLDHGILLIKRNGNFIYSNKCFEWISGYSFDELLGADVSQLMDPAEWEIVQKKSWKASERQYAPYRFDSKLKTKSDRLVDISVAAIRTMWCGNYVCLMIIINMAPPTGSETHIIQKQIDLEKRIQERTQQLAETNKAMSVLAQSIDQKWEEARKETDRKINSKILPIVDTLLKNTTLTDFRTELDMLKAYLTDISTHAAGGEGSIFMLSNAELRIASMIKNGYKIPEIGRKLFISENTVKTHRRKIRIKLGLRNSTINLAAYLRSKMH